MAFPTSAWPGSVDAPETRIDLSDIVYDDDFNYHDTRIIDLQTMFGDGAGQAIGELAASNEGPGGLASPVANGGVALKLAAKNAFTSGDVLQVLDDGVAGTIKARLNYAGLLWTLAGFDASAALIIPYGPLPAAGTAGRLAWDSTVPGLFIDNGVSWVNSAGGGGISPADWAVAYTYTQAATPVEEVVGQGSYDGSLVISGQKPYFRAIITPIFAGGPGTGVTVKLYDLGAPGSLLGVPRLVTTLDTIVGGGPQRLEQQLDTAVSAGSDEIEPSERIYEITIIQTSATGDSCYIGSAGMYER